MHRNRLALRTLMIAGLIGFSNAFLHGKMNKLEEISLNKPWTAPGDGNGKSIPSGKLKITPEYRPKIPKTEADILAIDFAQYRRTVRQDKARFNYLQCLTRNLCLSGRKEHELLYG